MAYLWRASEANEVSVASAANVVGAVSVGNAVSAASVNEAVEVRCKKLVASDQKRKEDVPERPIAYGRIDRLLRPARKWKRLA